MRNQQRSYNRENISSYPRMNGNFLSARGAGLDTGAFRLRREQKSYTSVIGSSLTLCFVEWLTIRSESIRLHLRAAVMRQRPITAIHQSR
jgi:hypothetical protein